MSGNHQRPGLGGSSPPSSIRTVLDRRKTVSKAIQDLRKTTKGLDLRLLPSWLVLSVKMEEIYEFERQLSEEPEFRDKRYVVSLNSYQSFKRILLLSSLSGS